MQSLKPARTVPAGSEIQMRTIFPLLIGSIAWSLAALAHAEPGIQWQSDLETARQVAASSNRLVLMHFSATWCHWCHDMPGKYRHCAAGESRRSANLRPEKIPRPLSRQLPLDAGRAHRFCAPVEYPTL